MLPVSFPPFLLGFRSVHGCISHFVYDVALLSRFLRCPREGVSAARALLAFEMRSGLDGCDWCTSIHSI